ncbi:hypothetical protein ACFLIM_29920 [Nonomuraea sp. M3C6]|uniref:Uncharacterized protein n=1 Tax=Nonomuraea marmarensis TaxID=3351344 RepID=A0ABW7ALW0_9ACTN
MRPLHTYPIFTALRSSVTPYQTGAVRTGFPVSEHLAACSVRVDLPAVDDAASHAYGQAITTALNDALTGLSTARLAS